jgi:hypothetical protein
VQAAKINTNTSGSQTTVVTAVTTYVMAAGETMQVEANQRSGGALNMTLIEFCGIWLTG